MVPKLTVEAATEQSGKILRRQIALGSNFLQGDILCEMLINITHAVLNALHGGMDTIIRAIVGMMTYQRTKQHIQMGINKAFVFLVLLLQLLTNGVCQLPKLPGSFGGNAVAEAG